MNTPVPVTSIFSEMIVSVGDIAKLLETHEVLIDSPDGFVEVTQFVNKGFWQEYVLESKDGKQVRCNESHLFETPDGWKYAGSMTEQECEVLTIDGIQSATVHKTGNLIPIVDLQINHPNHRYYTNGVSSHNTAVGKSLVLCHMASAAIAQGKNVLYITLEMAEERIAHRIDANLLDVSMDTIETMPKKHYENAFAQLRKRHVFGKLIIKEYPTSSGNVGHFRSLLDDLALKLKFVPDLVIIDYINICSSVRYKNSTNGQVNSYSSVKAIAEEIRGLSVEYNVPILSATQFTRGGYDSTDPGLTDTSESWGLPQTADLQLALVTSEELAREGLLLVKQLKNRYSDSSQNLRFTVKIDKSKMRISNDPLQQFSQAPVANQNAASVKSFTPAPKTGKFDSRTNSSQDIIY